MGCVADGTEKQKEISIADMDVSREENKEAPRHGKNDTEDMVQAQYLSEEKTDDRNHEQVSGSKETCF